MLDLAVPRPKEDVDTAIMQFCARRGYRLSRPWYLEGVRVEAPQPGATSVSGGFWSNMFDNVALPRIDVETKRKRNVTRVRIVVATTPESTRLAYELHSYLMEPRSFDQRVPSICPRCSTPVSNVTASYCGRCGERLIGAIETPVARPPIIFEPAVARPPPIPDNAVDERNEGVTPADEDEVERSFERPINAVNQADRAQDHSTPLEHSAPHEESRISAQTADDDDATSQPDSTGAAEAVAESDESLDTVAEAESEPKDEAGPGVRRALAEE